MKKQAISRAESDWMIIFLAGIVLVILAALGSAFIFWKVERGEIFVSERLSKNTTQNLDNLREDKEL